MVIRVPVRQVHCMRLQVSPGLVELVIKIKVQVVRLQIHDDKHGRHRAGELAKGVVNVLGLKRDALPEPFVMDLGGRAHFTAVLPRAGRVRVKRSSRAELALAECIHCGSVWKLRCELSNEESRACGDLERKASFMEVEAW